MLTAVRSYEEACRTFRWRVPERYNLTFDICDRQTMAGADGHRTALIVEAADGTVERYTFHVLRLLSNRLANVLRGRAVGEGDRVLVSFGPSVEAVVAVLAVLRLGAVAVPVSASLGEVPLSWRLFDSGAVAAIVPSSIAGRVFRCKQAAPNLFSILVAGDIPPGAPDGCEEMWATMENAPDQCPPTLTAADAPAFLFYPDDAMGKPPGVLHAHRVLLGNLPPMELALDFFPQTGDIFWTPADPMSFEGLLWGVLPAWHHGVPVLTSPLTDPAAQLALMGRHGVRAAFVPPRRLLQLAEAAATNPHAQLRALATGPRPFSLVEHAMVSRVFKCGVNEIWGSVESGAVAANCAKLVELRPMSPGRASPGVTVEAMDLQGKPVRAGESGPLGVAPGAPGTMLHHWNGLVAGRTRLPSGWQAIGLNGFRDLDGYLWPEEAPQPPGVVVVDDKAVCLDDVQSALASHPKVAAAGVSWHDDQELKAYVVPARGQNRDVQLARDLQAFIANRRGLHEVPRRIEFVDTLPTDDQGKVVREDLDHMPVRLDSISTSDRSVVSRSR